MANSNVSLKLPVGQKRGSNEICHIDEVERGRKCNCVCPGCEMPLIARKGDFKTHHFAHHTPPPESALSCAESALHKWAKNIVAKQKKWSMRAKHFSPKLWTTWLGEELASHDEGWDPFAERFFVIQDGVEEYDFGDWKPDVLLVGQYCGIESKIAVEIKVTHPVDEAKLKKVQKSDVNLLEIEISPDLMLGGILTEEALEQEILCHQNQLWLHTPLASQLKIEHDLDYEEKVVKPFLSDQDQKIHTFTRSLVGQDFEVPTCQLYEFPDDVHRSSFSFFANGQTEDLAAGKELITPRRRYPVSKTELLTDRIRLHLVVKGQKEHPIDLILHSIRAVSTVSVRPLENTSTLALLLDPKDAPESWLHPNRLQWIYSRRRAKVVKSLRNQLNDRVRIAAQQERLAQQKRNEAATKLVDRIITLFDSYRDSEPEWSRSHRDRFIKAREVARALGTGPYGGNGLCDRTAHDWIFGVPGQQWKTIVAAEMIIRPDFESIIKFNSLRFFLRKNRLTMNGALSSLWKVEKGRELFETQANYLGRTLELPTVGSALHYWLTHLAEVQPNVITTTGRFKKGFRWVSGQRERLLADAQDSLSEVGSYK